MPCNLVSGSEHHVLEGPPKIVSSGEKINVPVYNRLDYQEPAVWSKSVVTKYMGKQKLFTVRQLEPGHLEEDCPITTISEKKRLSSFSATDQLNSRPSTMQPLKSLKAGV